MVKDVLKRFLKPYEGKLLVLAFSGGADSMALFKALLEVGHPFVAAHIDHGWRESSEDEALWLKELAESKGIPFYLRTLTTADFYGNWEESARKQRLQFFNEVRLEVSAAAVILAHHADDQAETVLKRLFEGAFVSGLEGMSSETRWGEVVLLRPFLTLPKSALIASLEGMPYIEDATNASSQYLRGRMRTTLMPTLSAQFGKEVSASLLRLSENSKELNTFIQEALLSYPIHSGPFGAFIDFTSPPAPFLIKEGIKKVFKQQGIGVYHDEIQLLAEAILLNKANFHRGIGKRKVGVDRGVLFVFSDRPFNPFEWQITEVMNRPITDWKALWKGEGIGVLPSSQATWVFGEGAFKNWWSSHKTPAFLRGMIPVLSDGKEAPYEFLTGHMKYPYPQGVKIAIRHCAP
jgi:tRNA(Ile)-lysidine synthase